MRPAIILSLIVMLLPACGAGPARPPAAARFDFGPEPGPVLPGVAVAAVEVVAPSWLGGSAMQYRLLYAEPAHRREYAESRWVAPPAELLRQSLDRRLSGQAPGSCRLRIELDEFIQVFDSAASSGVTLSGRAILHASPELAARRRFDLRLPAPSPDARGGVAAAVAAVSALADDLSAWLVLTHRCRPE